MNYISEDTKKYEKQLMLASMEQSKRSLEKCRDALDGMGEQSKRRVTEAQARTALATIANNMRTPLSLRQATTAVASFMTDRSLSDKQRNDYKQLLKELVK